MLHPVHLRVSNSVGRLFLVLSRLVRSGSLPEVWPENSCLLPLETRVRRLVSRDLDLGTEPVSWRRPKKGSSRAELPQLAVISLGFIMARDFFHFTQAHLIHCQYENIDYRNFNIIL